MAEQKPTRRQHVVPKWYLKFFSTNKNRIGVLDREQQRRYASSVNNVGVINNFYDVSAPDLEVDIVERMLSEIEGPAASAVRNLVGRDTGSLSVDERGAVAAFLAAQVLRGEDQQSFIGQILDGVFKATMVGKTAAALRGDLEAALGRSVSEEEFENHRDFVRDPTAYSVTQPELVARLLAEHLEGFARVLYYGWTWRVVRFHAPVLITSDVPVGLWREDGGPVGLFTADRVFFPINPRCALVLTPRLDKDLTTNLNADAIEGDIEDLRVNVETAIGASHRWVFMHPDHDLYDQLPIPPKRGPIQGPAEVIDLARRMREAHEPAPEQ